MTSTLEGGGWGEVGGGGVGWGRWGWVGEVGVGGGGWGRWGRWGWVKVGGGGGGDGEGWKWEGLGWVGGVRGGSELDQGGRRGGECRGRGLDGCGSWGK